MLKIKRGFLDEAFWPQFVALDGTVIEAAVHRDLSDEKEQAEPKQLAIPLS